jgi:hypothetical protein
MKDFSTILLIHILRATIRCVEESPEIDACHPGIRRIESKRHFLAALFYCVAPEMPQDAPGGTSDRVCYVQC